MRGQSPEEDSPRDYILAEQEGTGVRVHVHCSKLELVRLYIAVSMAVRDHLDPDVAAELPEVVKNIMADREE